MNVDLIAIENEKKANKYVTISILIWYALLIGFTLYTVDETYPFEIKRNLSIEFGVVAIISAVSILLNFKLKDKYNKYKKYFLSFSLVLILGSFNLVFSEASLVLPALALGIINRYYDDKFMFKMMFVIGIVLFSFAFISTYIGMVTDDNVLQFLPGTTIVFTERSAWIDDYLLDVGVTREYVTELWAIQTLPIGVLGYICECFIFRWLNKSSNELFNKRIEAASKIANVERDLSIATKIQTSMLAIDFDDFEKESNLEIFASMKAARQVGGDFYDFFTLSDNKSFIVMGDVSGKGVPAALFMVQSLACIRNLAFKGLNPAEIMTQANTILNEKNSENFYVTLWIGMYDSATGDLQYANGGHVPPFISRDGIKFEELPLEINFVVGMMPGMEYVLESTTLSSGDRIFTCTDGVTDCANIDREFFGIERLHELLDACKDKNCKETVDTVVGALSDFQGEAEQFDDITMMMVRVK